MSLLLIADGMLIFRDDFSTYTKYEVGVEQRWRFVIMYWCGNQPFKWIFPYLFNIHRNNDASVVDNL